MPMRNILQKNDLEIILAVDPFTFNYIGKIETLSGFKQVIFFKTLVLDISFDLNIFVERKEHGMGTFAIIDIRINIHDFPYLR